MSDHDFRFYAKGAAFEDGTYDLRSMELLLSSYRSITDRLIAVQLGRRQLTPKIKKQIDYQVQIKPGSIEFLIDFVFTHKEVLTVLASDGGYQLSSTITKLFKEALNLRKEVAKVLEQKLPLNITINANINVGSGTLIANTGNGNIQIGDSNILWAAQVTKHSADRLVGGIDGNQIEFVELSGAGSEMKITEEDRVILGQNREELTAEISVIGRLDMVAFSSHKGTIIAENERFPVTWEEHLRNKIYKFADTPGIEFRVRPIIDQTGESLFLRKFVLGIQAQANSKNLTRPFMPTAPRPSCVRCVITSSRLYTTPSVTLRRHKAAAASSPSFARALNYE